MNKRDITKAVKLEFEKMYKTLTNSHQEAVQKLKTDRIKEFADYISTWTVPKEGAPTGMNKNSYMYDALLAGDSEAAAMQMYSVYSDKKYTAICEKTVKDKEKLKDNEIKVLGNLNGKSPSEALSYLESIGITIKEAEREQQALMSPVDVAFITNLRKEAK